jgi:hypothetical protein
LGENREAATRAGCQATSPLRKANATASDRLATPNLERIWLTWVLMVDGLTTSLSAICVLFNPSTGSLILQVPDSDQLGFAPELCAVLEAQIRYIIRYINCSPVSYMACTKTANIHPNIF